MLELQNCSKRLGHTHAVQDISLRLNAGERVAISGPNGAGKSTLLKLIAGIIKLDRGAVLWKGNALRGRVKRCLGYVPEAADPPAHLTVAELLHFISAAKNSEPCSRELVERLGLVELLGARVGELSLGQRRRASIAAALVGDPGLLILDEPTNGLDPAAIAELSALLREDDERIVLFVTHDADFASATATRKVALAGGRISP